MAISDDRVESLLEQSRAVLSGIDGIQLVVGLRQRVSVLRDQWGIAHIYAENSHDLFLAQGFCMAQDRLFQVDLWRRLARGETAELFGEDAIAADRFARLIRYRGDMNDEWTSYSPDTREIAEGFTAGINAWIDEIGDRLPIAFQLAGYRPSHWQPEDILGRMSGMIMSGNWEKEVARARLIQAVGVERAHLLAPTDPVRPFAFATGLNSDLIRTEILDGLRAATRLLKFTPSTSESNNWVVSGMRSASGEPLLASDPHRAITLPSLRYMVHLNAPGWNVIGSGEPALPARLVTRRRGDGHETSPDTSATRTALKNCSVTWTPFPGPAGAIADAPEFQTVTGNTLRLPGAGGIPPQGHWTTSASGRVAGEAGRPAGRAESCPGSLHFLVGRSFREEHDQERGHGTCQQGHQPPQETAAMLRLGQSGIDQ